MWADPPRPWLERETAVGSEAQNRRELADPRTNTEGIDGGSQADDVLAVSDG